MLVKILSMQRVVNYGSFMQAYAMKRILESYGHTVEFCDRGKGEPRHLGEKVRPVSTLDRVITLVKKFGSLGTLVEKRAFRNKTVELFEKEIWPILGMTPTPNLDYSGDVFLVGSDEVFNYTTNHAYGYVPAYFGHGVSARTIMAFAASAGYTNIEDIENDGMVEEISSGLAKFSAIAVRDQNTYDIVKRYSRHEPTLVVDPTLLYDFSGDIAANPGRKIADNCLLVYAYTGRLDTPEEIATIKAYAKAKGLKTVSVAFYHDWCDENLLVRPFELLSLFEQSRAVVTDTFHGTIFAIKSKKPFVSLLRIASARGSNSNKVGFLLTQLGLESQINTDLSQLARQIESPIDYDQVFRNLRVYQDRAKKFLDDALRLAEERLKRPAAA